MGQPRRRIFKKIPGALSCAQQRLNVLPQGGVSSARAIKMCGAGFRRGAQKRFGKHDLFGKGGLHDGRFIAHT